MAAAQLHKEDPSPRIPENKEKMKELILYISDKSMADEKFGSIKLNKLLFYSDFLAYLNFGKPITGMEYMRLDQGPAPKKFLPIAKELQKENALEIVEREYHGHIQKRPIARRPAMLELFTAREIALVDEVIGKLRGLNAHDVSELSHRFIGWKLADDGEVIPYSVAHIEIREPSPKAIAFGKELLRQVASQKSAVPH